MAMSHSSNTNLLNQPLRRPGESGLMAFLKSLMKSSWGTYRTKRMRA